MIWTRWWYGAATLLVVIFAWVSMFLLYPGMTPDTYNLSSTSPQSQPLFAHMYAPETATDATQYRWSEPQSSIVWSGLQLGSMAIATVQLADVGTPVTMMVDQYATTITGRRTVMMLLSDTQLTGQQEITLDAPAFIVPGDSRVLGIRLLSAGLIMLDTHAMPVVMQLSVAWLAVMLMLSIALLWRQYWIVGGLFVPLFVMLLIALNPLHATTWVASIALSSTIIPPMLYLLRRWVPRALLAVTAIVYGVRIWGIMYPPFAGHDYHIHLRRLQHFHDGAWIMTDNPFEFGQRISLILPFYYWLADLIGGWIGPHSALHMLMITSETATGIIVWLLLRQIGIATPTAQLAGILSVIWPLSSAVIWWAFMPQITAHMLTFLVMYLALRRDTKASYGVAIGMVFIAGMHIGEFIVAVVWYGLLRLGEDDLFRRTWWQRTVPVLLVVLLLGIAYGLLLRVMGGGTSLVSLDVLTKAPIYDMLARMTTAATVAWQPVPLMIAPLIVLIAVRTFGRVGWSWLGVGLIFWILELLTAAQVRYLYTVTPLLASGLAVILGPLWRKGRAARIFVLCIVGFIAWVSLALWIDGVMGWQKPRVDGLTH